MLVEVSNVLGSTVSHQIANHHVTLKTLNSLKPTHFNGDPPNTMAINKYT